MFDILVTYLQNEFGDSVGWLLDLFCRLGLHQYSRWSKTKAHTTRG